MRSFFTLGCAALGILMTGAAPPSAPHAPRSFTIEINDFAFGTAPSGIRIGDAVEWANHDIVLHSVTAQDKSFDVDIAPDGHARVVMRKPGVIRYICKYHPGMTGEITVGR